jgi:flagellar biosynthetic protein FliO
MEVLEQMTAVVLVLLLLAGSLWWLRRRGFAAFTLAPHHKERRMECLERLTLGPQHTLHLVRVGEAELLLASSPSGCTLVETLPHREPVR